MPVIDVFITDNLYQLLEDLFNPNQRGALDYGEDEEYEGWYCINVKPIKCFSCGGVIAYAEPRGWHLIVVWEDKDDEEILSVAEWYKEQGAEPRIESYHPYLGRCIPYENVVKLNG